MAVRKYFAQILRQFAEKVLDIDDTTANPSTVEMLGNYAQRFDFDEDANDLKQFLEMLRKKHMVDTISIARHTGSIVATSNGVTSDEALNATAMFNYVKSELPRSEVVLVKERDWYMLFPYNRKVYMIKAPSNLTTVELKALARECEEFLLKNGNGQKEIAKQKSRA